MLRVSCSVGTLNYSAAGLLKRLSIVKLDFKRLIYSL
jgi:hypothetical protein